MAATRKVFVSFAAADAPLADYLVGQARNERSGFALVDMPVKHALGRAWKAACWKKIKGSDGMLIILTKHSEKSDAQAWQVKCAAEEGIARTGIWEYDDVDRPTCLPAEMNGVRIINWTWANIRKWLETL